MNISEHALPPPDSFDLDADIVIVGGGGTGLAAAVRGAEIGAEVLLLEKNPHLGGSTGIAVGSMTACGTSMQRAEGIEDDPKEHNEDIGKFKPELEPRSNKELRGFFTENSAATIEWLRELGVQFHGPIPEPPNRVARMHNIVPNAKAYVAVMHRRALRLGVKIRTETGVDALYRDSDGRVMGVQARDASGKAISIEAHGGVILAAGDFSANTEMKRKYMSDADAEVEAINPTATGEGQLLGLSVGAELRNMDIALGPQIRFVPPARKPFAQLLPTTPWMARVMAVVAAVMPNALFQRFVKSLLVTWQHPEPTLFQAGAVLINQQGQRFTNELETPAHDIPKQTDKSCYFLFDHMLATQFSEWPHFISTAPGISYAYVKDYKKLRPDVYAEADTLEELATKIGVPSEALAETARKINACRGQSQEDAFGRPAFATGLEKGPFYALGPAKSWIVLTEGGLAVNDKLEVLDASDQPIRGLYAGGTGAQGGMIIWGHGLHICWAVTSGRLAAENAAARLDRRSRAPMRA